MRLRNSGNLLAEQNINMITLGNPKIIMKLTKNQETGDRREQEVHKILPLHGRKYVSYKVETHKSFFFFF